jgi:hypothetical protein
MPAGAVPQYLRCLFVSESRSVRSVLPQGTLYIDNREYLRSDFDLIASEPSRISATVELFVMLPNEMGDAS